MRKLEAEASIQERERDREYDDKILAANAHAFDSRQKLTALVVRCLLGVAVLIAVIIVFAISKDNTDVVMEIVKAIVLLGSGGAGGYAAGKLSGGNANQ